MVDTNLLACLLLPTLHAAQAEALLLKDPDWIAPALIHSELRNFLVGAVRRKDIEADDGRVLMDRAAEVITVPEGGVDGEAVLSLALDSGCSAYDCEFVWLASDLRVLLVTADRQLLGAFLDTAVPADVFLHSLNEDYYGRMGDGPSLKKVRREPQHTGRRLATGAEAPEGAAIEAQKLG